MRPRPRVCAVSYLNTSPLVWGLLHGPQHGLADLRFTLPSQCAEALKSGAADVGLVPVIELARQRDLAVIPGSAIACQGPVRSILLISKKPMDAIETLAADAGSRTSVVVTQVILHRKYGRRPAVETLPANLDAMLERADAALIIGDPALRIDPQLAHWQGLPVHVYDMGAEWVELTGLPMVFAAWAAREYVEKPAGLAALFEESKRFGLSRVDEIVESESKRLGFPGDLVREYITRHISYDLGGRERRSLRLFLSMAADLGLAATCGEVRYAAEAVVAERR